jgi:hypothetical protein
MNKAIVFLFLFSLLLITGCRQQSDVKSTDPDDVAAAVGIFIKGIVNADENLLNSITSEDLVYAHSNGRVQNKPEFIAEILNPQGLDFLNAGFKDQTIRISGETAVVRHVLVADTVRNNGATGTFIAGNMMIWQNRDGKWKLLARQSYRLPGQ